MKLISCHIDNFGGLRNFDHNFDEGMNIVLQDNGWGKTTLAAFLKAMIYGFDSKRSKDITENERRRYYPWQGGKYGGYLVFEAEGKQYRIERTFGETPRYDRAKVMDLTTHMTAKIDPDTLGEYLFHLDANAFQRSVFINQNGILMDGNAASSIHTRLNALVSQANDLAAYDGAIDELTQQIKVYEKTGNRGRLGDVSRMIAEKEETRDRLAIDIQHQDEHRLRIAQIDRMISALEKDLKEKKKKLDKIAGDAKKKETTQKMLTDLEEQIAPLSVQLETIRNELGGDIPDADRLEETKGQKEKVTTLKEQMKSLEKTYQKLERDRQAILERYAEQIPKAEILDEIQNTYGELQGVLSTEQAEPEKKRKPQGYDQFAEVVQKDDTFLKDLNALLDSEQELQNDINRRNATETELKHAKEQWKTQGNQHRTLREEINTASREMQAKEAYRPEQSKEAIQHLEAIQSIQQKIDLRTEESRKTALKADEKALLDSAADSLPTEASAKEAVAQLRIASQRRAEADALRLQKDGEQTRAEGLRSTVESLKVSESNKTEPISEPKKTTGLVMLAGGLVIAVVAFVLWMQNKNTLMLVGVGIGVLLAIGGIINLKGYKGKLQAYETDVSKIKANEEAGRQRAEAEGKLKVSLEAAATLDHSIEEKEKEISASEQNVSKWLKTYHGETGEPTEAAIYAVMDRAKDIRALQEKQASFEKVDREIQTLTRERDELWDQVVKQYPAVAGMKPQDALMYLRNAGTEFQMARQRYDAVSKRKEQFEKETGIPLEKDWPEASEEILKMEKVQEATNARIRSATQAGQKLLAKAGIEYKDENIIASFPKARKRMTDYQQYTEWLAETSERQEKLKQKTNALKEKLAAQAEPLGEVYAEKELPDRIAMIRKDIQNFAKISEQMEENRNQSKVIETEISGLEDAVMVFVIQYIASPDEKSFDLIAQKTAEYRDAEKTRDQLTTQKSKIEKDMARLSPEENGEIDESALRDEITGLEAQRDEMLVEYTQKSEAIRLADQSLIAYPEIQQEISTLYEEKQKMQSTLSMLKRTIQMITQAKENLANRYLSRVENLFNQYMKIWLNNEQIRGILDIDFNIRIEEGDAEHVAEGYSTGYCDMMDFCMRLALVDTLFENEQPFLIMDDPFVNLDEERLDKALELLDVLSSTKQVIYFVCHPIRAVEKEGNTASRKKFAEIAEATRKNLVGKKANKRKQKPVYVRQSTRELYKVVNEKAIPVPLPTDRSAIITNSIFSLQFALPAGSAPRDTTYEVFFIDAVGHVLNERQLFEVRDGRIADDKVWFSLNTRDDSGDTYELMIRENGQADYEVLERIPYQAKVTFSGTSMFDI